METSTATNSKRTTKNTARRGRGLPRRAKDLSKEELLLTLKKKRECNDKALKIVEGMLDSNVSEEWFLDALQHLNQSHFQDIAEERAITQLCGYPLCSNELKNVPSQQYRISTKLNKVYDIKERKNFCSNRCYKASNFIKDQMHTSPLWLRDIEPSVKFVLMPSTVVGGGAGDEVNVHIERVSKEEIRQLSGEKHSPSGLETSRPLSSEQSLADALNNLQIIADMRENTPLVHSKHDSNFENDFKTSESTVSQRTSSGEKVKSFLDDQREGGISHSAVNISNPSQSKIGSIEHTRILKENELQVDDVKLTDTTSQMIEECVSRPAAKNSLMAESYKDVMPLASSSRVARNGSQENLREKASEVSFTGLIVERDKALEEEQIKKKSYNFTKSKFETSKICTSSEISPCLEVDTKHTRAENSITILEKPVSPQDPSNMPTISTSSCESREISPQKELKKGQKRKHSSSSSIPAVVYVENCVQEWFTMETMCFLFGESALKEMLEQKGESIQEHYKALRSITWDPEKHERFLAICKRLSLLEMEDSNFDNQVMRCESDSKRKPLPNYDELKKEAEKMELKVRAFYQGKIEIDERKVSFAEDVKNDSTDAEKDEPQIPLVHLHSQRALRKKIVLDGLNRVLPDFLRTFGMRPSELTSSVRGLVSTFALSATNITFKPQEWSLLGLVVIKILTLREPELKRCLQQEQSNTYLTLMLMSYKQEPGYLDRLLSWLTDIDKLLARRPQTSEKV